jgi:hypothetical protein
MEQLTHHVEDRAGRQRQEEHEQRVRLHAKAQHRAEERGPAAEEASDSSCAPGGALPHEVESETEREVPAQSLHREGDDLRA